MAKAPPPPDPVFTLRGSAAPINALHFQCSGPGPPLLYSGLEKGSVDVWNLNTRRTERVLDGHHGASVIWVSTLPSSDTLLSQGRDMRVCVWDLCEGRSTVTHTLHTGSVGFCQCSQLEADISTTLLAIPGETTEEVKVVDLGSLTTLCSLTPDAKRGMLMCMKMWQIQAPVVLTNPGVSQLRIRGDSKIVASAGWDCRVRVHSWKSLNPLAVLCYHRDQVRCVTFSDHPESTQTLMAAGSRDQLISLWSIYSASRGTRPERHERYRTAGEFKRCPLDWPGLACIHHMGLITGAGPGWPGQGGLAC
ncbi:guanine nucleotide-binding protein subunit beta-like protein 1 isoform X7 [Electrophorus electricus]|uniref:guanine nucleotide-binding protein subunit beta-like protein 1 isoform X7 n=1 Tax=Electrophorus electricus TaxID=8005 RepID=UPI0015CFC64B|nr:guanine nucleotide-binding protein subunit beta-like protein 1 isoform X7 [Electrophorus electricus]